MLEKGRRYNDMEVLEHIGGGGQGQVYRVAGARGREMALKVFDKAHSTDSDELRAQFLAGQKLWERSPTLRAAPQRVERIDGHLAHRSEFVDGRSLREEFDEFVDSGHPPWTFRQGLEIASSVVEGVEICERNNIGLGDIADSNVLVQRTANRLGISLIDFDNFSAPNVPQPRMIGQRLYLGAELLPGNTPPTVVSDRHALGVLLHQVLLLAYPNAGRDDTPEEHDKAVTEGRWYRDPTYPKAGRAGGYPAEILSADFHRLFRLSQSAEFDERPPAGAWSKLLNHYIRGDGASRIHECSNCQEVYIADITKDRCPYCGMIPPVLAFAIDGNLILLEKGAQSIGRRDLGGSKCTSNHHVVVRRNGPQTLVEDTSSSGTWRFSNGAWTRVSARQPFLVSPGDELRLGDVRVRVVAASAPRLPAGGR